jgi:hypothetical protein
MCEGIFIVFMIESKLRYLLEYINLAELTWTYRFYYNKAAAKLEI